MQTTVKPPPGQEGFEQRTWRYYLYKWARLRLTGDQAALERSVRSLVGIRNDKLWFLVASAIIASVGLNTNSPAVVIGAMLVSPLMGPMVGIGYAFSIRDRRLAWKAGRYLLISVGISFAISALYFFISPLQDATPEILSRTKPNLLDLVVAVAAALAGVIALASVEMSIALPGVAIATAIMPPLCASAYGFATWQPRLAFGSFYLFVVNAAAIALCSYFLFRRMHVEELGAEDASRMPRWLYLAITVLFLMPLSFALYDTASENRQARRARAFAEEVSDRYSVANWEFTNGREPLLSMFLFNSPTTGETAALQSQFEKRIPKGKLRVMTADVGPEVRQTLDDLRNSIIDSNTALQQIQVAVEEQRRKEELEAALHVPVDVAEDRVLAEWRVFEDRVMGIEYFSPATGSQRVLVKAAFKRPLTRRERRAYLAKWEAWLGVRLGREVELVVAE